MVDIDKCPGCGSGTVHDTECNKAWNPVFTILLCKGKCNKVFKIMHDTGEVEDFTLKYREMLARKGNRNLLILGLVAMITFVYVWNMPSVVLKWGESFQIIYWVLSIPLLVYWTCHLFNSRKLGTYMIRRGIG